MEDGSRIRVLVVDQSAFARAALPRLIEADPQLEVVGVSREGEEGLHAVSDLDPDVVLMGLHAPRRAALELLDRMVTRSPRPVIMLMPHDAMPHEHVLVLEAGAVIGLPWDVDDSPARLMAFQSLLASKLKTFGAARVRPGDEPVPRKKGAAPAVESPAPGAAAEEPIELLEEKRPARGPIPRSPLALANTSGLVQPKRILAQGASDVDRHVEVAVIGAGAGGPAAFRRIVTQLPPNLNVALLGLVRMPEELLAPFADRLAKDSTIRVSVALEGDAIRPGVLLLAPVDSNLGLVRTGRIPKALVRLVTPEPGGMVPSFDITLRACSTIYGNAVLGVILSGLSRDGIAGLQAVKGKGGMTAVLDHTSAVVASTNRMCEEAGAVDQVVDIQGAVALIARLGMKS